MWMNQSKMVSSTPKPKLPHMQPRKPLYMRIYPGKRGLGILETVLDLENRSGHRVDDSSSSKQISESLRSRTLRELCHAHTPRESSARFLVESTKIPHPNPVIWLEFHPPPPNLKKPPTHRRSPATSLGPRHHHRLRSHQRPGRLCACESDARRPTPLNPEAN